MTEVKKTTAPAGGANKPARPAARPGARPGARPAGAGAPGGRSYGSRPAGQGGQGGPGGPGGRRPARRDAQRPTEDEFDQKIVDLARVTRVMAGGKRMRFRACVAIGNHSGKVGVGLAKGVDVTAAITKAVNQAKKSMLTVPIANGSIPHQVDHKFGAAHIIIKPASVGKGIICGGVIRIIAELAGIHNMTGKILGTGNNVANAKCTMEALAELRWPKGVTKKLAPATDVVEAKTETADTEKTEAPAIV
ncbi:MAG: 30S ribosomal protein S5 [Candidatus Falkowbacteria bacterium]